SCQSTPPSIRRSQGWYSSTGAIRCPRQAPRWPPRTGAPGAVTEAGEPVPALVARHRDRYPPEVPARRPATTATDIYLATGCMRELMGARAHPALLRFAAGCTLPEPRRRPKDAWRLLAEPDELLEDLYGPRKFRPFTVPR